MTVHQQLGAVANDEWDMLIHDLRSPLATVCGYTQLLLGQARDGDSRTIDEGLRHIQDAASRLQRLLDQLATAPASIASASVCSQRCSVDLVGLARRLAAQSGLAAGTPGRVSVLTAVNEACGHWDVVQIERVLTNLIDNALKYSAPDASVVVAIRRTNRWAVLCVADRGIGIPPADLPKVFNRGFRAANAVDKAPGRGLGLAAVQGIIQSLEGTLSVDSQPGVGTTITVRLPLQPQTEACAA